MANDEPYLYEEVYFRREGVVAWIIMPIACVTLWLVCSNIETYGPHGLDTFTGPSTLPAGIAMINAIIVPLFVAVITPNVVQHRITDWTKEELVAKVPIRRFYTFLTLLYLVLQLATSLVYMLKLGQDGITFLVTLGLLCLGANFFAGWMLDSIIKQLKTGQLRPTPKIKNPPNTDAQ